MFKKAMTLSCLSLFTSTVWATPFNGFYGGADFGLSQATFKKNQQVSLNVAITGTPIIDIPIANKKELSDTSILGNIDLGFSHVFAQYFFVGLEGSVDFQSLEVENAPALQEAVSGFALPFATEVTLKNEFALTVNPGIVFNKTTLLYGKIGPAWGRFSTEGTATYSQNFGGPQANANTEFKDSNFYKSGLRLGLGVEHYVTEHMTLKLELINTDYGTIRSGSPSIGAVSTTPSSPDVAGQLSNSDRIKASNATIMFGFNYRC